MLGNKVILKLNSETGRFPRRNKAFAKASSLSGMQHPYLQNGDNNSWSLMVKDIMNTEDNLCKVPLC